MKVKKEIFFKTELNESALKALIDKKLNRTLTKYDDDLKLQIYLPVKYDYVYRSVLKSDGSALFFFKNKGKNEEFYQNNKQDFKFILSIGIAEAYIKNRRIKDPHYYLENILKKLDLDDNTYWSSSEIIIENGPEVLP